MTLTPNPNRRLLKICRKAGHPYYIPRDYRHNDAFIANHQARPEIYETLVSECRKWKNQHGMKKVGIAFIWERLRYIFVIHKRLGEEFKLNNNYKGAYARVLMFNEPDLEGFITIREMGE